MTLSIKLLKDAVDAGRGVTLASQYRIEFLLPQALKAADESYTPYTLSIMAQSVTLAGRQIATSELPVYGTPIKMPYGLVYQDLAISFLCTNNMAQRTIFEEWQRLIVDPTTNYANYYDIYIGEIIVEKLDQRGAKTHRIHYEEVFPIAIFEQELAAASNDWLRLTVQFSYRRWRSHLEQVAAKKAGFPSSTSAPGPGSEMAPDDVFAGIRVPGVPEFKP